MNTRIEPVHCIEPIHFAALAVSAMERIDERGRGASPRKVFISALHVALVAQGWTGTLADTKACVLAASRAGTLQTARCDIPRAMPSLELVHHSETRIVIGGVEAGCIHFVVDPGAKEPWETAAAQEGR